MFGRERERERAIRCDGINSIGSSKAGVSVAKSFRELSQDLMPSGACVGFWVGADFSNSEYVLSNAKDISLQFLHGFASTYSLYTKNLPKSSKSGAKSFNH